MPAKAAAARPRARKPPEKTKTKWGDREGRRRDILAAARAQMAGGGYLALNMRDIARGAGVSPGTLYSYFATKEEIFATLYAEAIEEHNERIEPLLEAATDVEGLLYDLATAYLELYTAYGRYFTMWSALVVEGAEHDSPLPVELAKSLRAATFRQTQLIRDSLVRVAAANGLELVDPPKVLTFIGSVLNGIGDQVTSERRHLSPFTADEQIAYAVKVIAAGITIPAR